MSKASKQRICWEEKEKGDKDHLEKQYNYVKEVLNEKTLQKYLSWSHSYFQITEMRHCQEQGDHKDAGMAY